MNKAIEFLKANDLPLGVDEEGNPIALSDDEILFNDIVSLLEQYAQQRYDEGFFDGIESVRQSLIPNHQNQKK